MNICFFEKCMKSLKYLWVNNNRWICWPIWWSYSNVENSNPMSIWTSLQNLINMDFFFFFVEMYSVQTLTAKATCTLMCMLVIFISFYCGNESCVQISRASFWMCFEDLLWTSTLNGLIICLQYPQSICFWFQMPLNLHIKTNIQWIQYS